MDGRHVLVINCGSSSIKFALVDPAQTGFVLSGLAERLSSAEAVLHCRDAVGKTSTPLPQAGHAEVMNRLLPQVQSVAGHRLAAIGHRVVHGGERFTGACRIEPEALAAIRETSPLAPLHNPANLLGIDATMAVFPALPQIAVFDTAFHQTLPEHAFRYAVPDELYRRHGVRRYGFHGTSHRYVSRRAAELCGMAPDRGAWLIAHLGNGCSTCAVQDGRSLDTSMGLTPLEGLVMGTRSGDVDPNLHSHLARTLGWSLEQIDRMLNHASGLKGLSGLSNDMRTLEQEAAKGHTGAMLAIGVFCYRLAKSLAAMSCALTQLDGLVFTGGIGENASRVRARAVGHLRLLNFRIDPEANDRCVAGAEGAIHAQGTPRILVVPTNEERQIALETLALLD